MLSTFASVLLFGLCLFLIFGNVPLPVATGSGIVGAALGLDAVRFANEVTIVALYFFGFAAVYSGMAWWACAMALKGRNRFGLGVRGSIGDSDRETPAKGFDVNLRA